MENQDFSEDYSGGDFQGNGMENGEGMATEEKAGNNSADSGAADAPGRDDDRYVWRLLCCLSCAWCRPQGRMVPVLGVAASRPSARVWPPSPSCVIPAIVATTPPSLVVPGTPPPRTPRHSWPSVHTCLPTQTTRLVHLPSLGASHGRSPKMEAARRRAVLPRVAVFLAAGCCPSAPASRPGLLPTACYSHVAYPLASLVGVGRGSVPSRCPGVDGLVEFVMPHARHRTPLVPVQA